MKDILKSVFNHFETLTTIPRGSQNREGIRAYLCAFARKHALAYRTDSADNVIILKPAAGSSTAPAVILQGHTDMVCACAEGYDIDFYHEPLRLRQKDGYLYAEGTSLGGDDGIAVAMMLALLESDLELPALECIFTADEEIGMVGATALDMSDMRGKYLINIDSDEEGVITVSCAGGSTAALTLPTAWQEEDARLYDITVSGLKGGHSGTEIHLGGLNANKVLGEVLQALGAPRIAHIGGGEKENAIAVSAHARVAPAHETDLEALLLRLEAEYKQTEPNIKITSAYQGLCTQKIMTAAASAQVIQTLCAVPNGVMQMSAYDTSAVQTSLNLGVLEQTEDTVVFTFSVRSSVSAEREALEERLRAIAQAHGGTLRVSGVYPAWSYNPHSVLRDTAVQVFEKQYGYAPELQSIHAGLECGVLAAKKADLECISIGPQMYDIHTARERLEIASVQRTCTYLISLIKALAAQPNL